MKIVGPYSGWLTLNVWRKKSTLLIIFFITIFTIFSFQYYSTLGREKLINNQDDAQKLQSVQEKRSLLSGASVQFVVNSSDTISIDNLQVNIPDESPSLYDIMKKMEGSQVDKNMNENMMKFKSNLYIPKQRVIHLDLKGAPPKVSYINKVLKLSKDMGATGVLLEWEDMFPWKDNLSLLKAVNAYTKADVKKILDYAQEIQLDVIPLIQTFGHVEFALKLKEFSHLREVPESAQALCPSLNESIDFVQIMINQVMEMHPDVKYLHIGCDEVFQMGECIRCRSQPKENLYLSHVAKVANYVRNRYPNVTPIIWDDMLRHLPQTSMEQYQIGQLVEPMVWVYAEDVYRFVQYSVWDKYAAVFPNVWTASAFKGAFGESLYIPNIKRHLDNNLRWLEVMNNEERKFKNGFRGIVITGWQRYDHFSVLCELLPAAIPSLAVTVTAITNGYMNSSLRMKLNTYLNCGLFGPTSFFNLNADPYLWDSYSRCAFPGHAFYKLTYRLNSAEKEADEFIQAIRKLKGWMTDYNVRRNFSTPLRLDELMQDEPRIYHTITSLARSAKDALGDVFDEYTIAEWVEQKIYPYILQLEQIQKDAVDLRTRKYWPKRPFPILKDLHRFGVLSNFSNSVTFQ